MSRRGRKNRKLSGNLLPFIPCTFCFPLKASRWQGNHPEANHQFYSDEDTLEQFGRLTRVYTSLANYTRAAVAANSEAGTPVMRPLFLMFEDDPMAHQQDYECAGSQIFF